VYDDPVPKRSAAARRSGPARAPEPTDASSGEPSDGDERSSRRRRLLRVAIELFTHHGVRRTSIEELAEAAQIAKGSVYLEFRSKDELFRAAAEQLVGELVVAAERAAQKPGTLTERLTAVLAAKFWPMYELVHSRPHARELLDTKEKVAAAVFRRADDRFAALLLSELQAAVSRGQWQPRRGLTPRQVADVLLRAAHGTSYGPERLSAAAFRARLQLGVGLILDGAAQP
jgi:AcrR family transcriptional regulator